MLAEWFTSLLAWLSWLVGRRTKRAGDIGAGQTVVIVGGGFAGLTLAHYLDSSTAFDVVLYEKRDYFEYTPSMLRVVVDPAHMAVSHLPFERVALGRVKIVQQEVVQLAQGAVRGRGGEWTKYDKLVLAMGSDYPGQRHVERRTATALLQAWRAT